MPAPLLLSYRPNVLCWWQRQPCQSHWLNNGCAFAGSEAAMCWDGLRPFRSPAPRLDSLRWLQGGQSARGFVLPPFYLTNPFAPRVLLRRSMSKWPLHSSYTERGRVPRVEWNLLAPVGNSIVRTVHCIHVHARCKKVCNAPRSLSMMKEMKVNI
jgi:hypothetical protein